MLQEVECDGKLLAVSAQDRLISFTIAKWTSDPRLISFITMFLEASQHITKFSIDLG